MPEEPNCAVEGCTEPWAILATVVMERRLEQESHYCQRHGKAFLRPFEVSDNGGVPRARESELASDVELLVHHKDDAEVLLLVKEKDGHQRICISVGLAEASNLYTSIHRFPCNRPRTHELMLSAISACDGRLASVGIVGCEHDQKLFFAELRIELDNELKLVDARPSDAINLAYAGCVPIFVCQSVFDATRHPGGWALTND